MCRGRPNGDAVPRLGWRLRLVAGERVRALVRLFDVDSCLRIPEEAAVAARAGCEDLAQDRESRFGRAIRADVESRGSGDALELVLLDARLEQPLAPALLVSPRPEGADVESLGALGSRRNQERRRE